MNDKTLTEINARLQCPKIILKRLSRGRQVPQIFVDVSLNELISVIKLLEKQKKQS